MAKSTGGATVVLAWLVVMILSLVTGVLSSLLLWPPMIHAGLKRTIDFKPMVAFTKDFLRRNWKETLLAQLFLVLSGMIVTTLGMLALCVGIYIATAIVMLAQHHLMHQVYELHLQRGGISVEEKPSLNVELVTPDGPSGELDDMA